MKRKMKVEKVPNKMDEVEIEQIVADIQIRKNRR